MTAAAPTRTLSAELTTYLHMLARARRPGRLIEIRYLTGRGEMSRLFVPARRIDIAARTIASLAGGTDVYCGVLLRARYAGGRDAVADPQLVWVEIDRPDALDRLEQFEHPPPVIKTGQPVAVRELLSFGLARLQRRQFAQQVGIDGAQALDLAQLSRTHPAPAGIRRGIAQRRRLRRRGAVRNHLGLCICHSTFSKFKSDDANYRDLGRSSGIGWDLITL